MVETFRYNLRYNLRTILKMKGKTYAERIPDTSHHGL